MLEGEGLVIVKSEEKKVIEGNCIFVPPDESYGLKNDGRADLTYYNIAPYHCLLKGRCFVNLACGGPKIERS